MTAPDTKTSCDFFRFLPHVSPTMSDQLPARVPRLGGAIAFIVFTAAVAFLFASLKRPSPAPEPPAQSTAQAAIPGIELTTPQGERFASSDLLGKLWVVSFWSPENPEAGRHSLARLTELERFVIRADSSQIGLLTIILGSQNPLPPELARIEMTPAPPNSPTRKVARSSETTIQPILENWPLAPDRVPPPSFSPDQLMVVDAQGRICVQRDARDPQAVQQLLADLAKLFQQKSPGGRGRQGER